MVFKAFVTGSVFLMGFAADLAVNAQKASFSYAGVHVPEEHVFINEIMAKNSLFPDDYGEADDWLELYNSNTYPVDIGGFYLSDDFANPTRWKLPDSLVIPAGGFAVIWTDGEPEQGSLHASFKLSSSGEEVMLSQEVDGVLHRIDSVRFDTIPENVTYGRKIDGTDTWCLLGEPTPGSTNNESDLYLKAPSVSVPGGLYTDNQSIELYSGLPEVTIYYTLDGSVPDQGSTLYTAPIQISGTTLLKARAFKDGHVPSALAEGFYLFGHHSDLPVVSLSTDPYNLWDDSLGIYTKGTNGAMHHCCPEPANWFQEWERPALVTMFEPDGKMAFTEKAGLALGGNDSRKFIQKSFNIHFRRKYGSRGIDYQVFPDLEMTHFKHLKLRNSGQDFGSMMMRDGINHSLLQGVIDLDVMAYRPAVVYLNGEYWGMYGLRESLTDDYIAAHFQVDRSDIDLISGNGSREWLEVESGSADDFLDLYNFIESHDLSNGMHYDSAAARIDMDEYLNYQIAQIYYANYDWPGNNIKLWRSRTIGLWHWMLLDTDASTNFSIWGDTQADFNTLDFVTSPYSTEWPNNKESTLFLRKLLQNHGFKYEFVQRTCTYMATIFHPDRVTGIVNGYLDLVDSETGSEIDRQIEKWTRNYPDLGMGATCGGSKETWISYIEEYKDFFEERPGHMIQHMRDYFNNDSTYTLSINYDEQTNGSIYLHSNEFKIPYNFSAEYFSNYPMVIKAVPDSGYVFVRWLETGNTYPVMNYFNYQSASLTPLFAEENSVGISEPSSASSQCYLHVFPNPVAAEQVHIYFNGTRAGERVELRVYNMLGEELERIILNGTGRDQVVPVSITGWNSGIYILALHGESIHRTAKLIVKSH